jgi:hypothetical protein
MDSFLELWTAYHSWASNLDAEGRFYIIAGSLLLVTIYTCIHCSGVDGIEAASNRAQSKKTFRKDQR